MSYANLLFSFMIVTPSSNIPSLISNDSYYTQIKDADFAKVPKWKMSNEAEPRLSPRKAMALALQAAPQYYEKQQELQVKQCSLVQYKDEDWYWIVQLTTKVLSNDRIEMVVLMDGRVLKLRKR